MHVIRIHYVLSQMTCIIPPNDMYLRTNESHLTPSGSSHEWMKEFLHVPTPNPSEYKNFYRTTVAAEVGPKYTVLPDDKRKRL